MGMDILDRGRDGQVGLEELRTDFALRAPVDEHWRNHLNRIPIGNSNRFFELDGNALLEMVNLFDIAGNSVYTTPRVRVCTVHQAKGAEADNVVLINMMPAKTVKALQGDDPAVHQVAYVAITRARETFWDVVYIEDEPPQHVSHYQY